MLSVKEVVVRFGGVVALDGPTFAVDERRDLRADRPERRRQDHAVQLRQPPLRRPTRARSRSTARTCSRAAPHEIAALGIARTFQNLALCPALTVLENVMVGAHHRRPRRASSPRRSRLPGARREERELREQADDMLERLGLADVADRPAVGLPYGTLKRVELARALCQRPRLLLLDEPASGLSHGEVDELGRPAARAARRLGLTVLLVEHHMGMVMRISDQVVVLDFGRKIADGTPGRGPEGPERSSRPTWGRRA